jgi:SAM-dependent methyltransferase
MRMPEELFPRVPGPVRALDIGCGSGYLLVALQAAGYEAEGLECDPTAAATARTLSKQTVHEGDFRSADLPRGAYHLIVLSHVFEHLDDPRGALARLTDLLAPGGRLGLIYPNPDSLGACTFGEVWFPWDAPRHLVLPTGEAVARAAQDCGLKPITVRTSARGAAGYSAWSRAYREQRPVDLFRPAINFRDRVVAACQRVLCRLGFQLGDEVVVVLEKGRAADGT